MEGCCRPLLPGSSFLQQDPLPTMHLFHRMGTFHVT